MHSIQFLRCISFSLPSPPSQGESDFNADFRVKENSDRTISFESVTCPGGMLKMQSGNAIVDHFSVFLLVSGLWVRECIDLMVKHYTRVFVSGVVISQSYCHSKTMCVSGCFLVRNFYYLSKLSAWAVVCLVSGEINVANDCFTIGTACWCYIVAAQLVRET